MRKRLYIYGAGGLGKEILSLARSLEEWDVRGFLDDAKEVGTAVKGVPVIGNLDSFGDLESSDALVLAIGDPRVKKKIAGRISDRFQCPVLMHPSVIIQDPSSVNIGPGTVLCAGAILTTDIVIGSHVLINLNATVGHDSRIGSYSSVMPGVNIAGEVFIDECVLLGSGCNIRNRVTVGSEARVGMGAVVLRDVIPGKTVVGVPAR